MSTTLKPWWVKFPWRDDVDETDGRECVRCGVSISLRPECEWQDITELNLCDGCTSAVMEEMWERLNRRPESGAVEALVKAAIPFSFGLDKEFTAFPLFYDLEDDVIVYSNYGKHITAGDFRALADALAKHKGRTYAHQMRIEANRKEQPFPKNEV